MATTEEKMTTPKYLTTLGWDAEKWTVLKEAEWLPLQKVSGYQTYVYDAVKDPTGRELFGKNARVVKTEWMNKHMASVTEVAAPPVEVDNTPPPPVQEADTTPPPPANVPEEIKEIAKVSPNVEIVSVPPAENKSLGLRKAQMAAIGWTVNDGSESMTKGEEIVGYDYLNTCTDDEFYAMLSAPTKKAAIDNLIVSAAESVKNIEVVEEELKNDWDKFVHDRVEQLISFRFKVDEKDKELLHTSDGEMISYEDIDTMENDDWIAYIKLYKSLMAATPGKEKELRQVQIKKAEERAEETAKATAKKIEDQRIEDDAKRKSVETEKSKKLQEAADKKSQELTEEAEKEKEKAIESVTGNGKESPKEKISVTEKEAEFLSVHPDVSMTTGDTGGFFHQLATLGFGSAILQMSKDENGEITVRFNIKDTDETCSSDSVIFKDMVGTPEELDKIFMERISQPFK